MQFYITMHYDAFESLEIDWEINKGIPLTFKRQSILNRFAVDQAPVITLDLIATHKVVGLQTS